MKRNKEKYRINALLEGLTVREYKFAMRVIPEVLNVSVNTFHNYRRIQVGSRQDIPYEKMKQLEILFGIQSGALETTKIKGKSLVEMYKAV